MFLGQTIHCLPRPESAGIATQYLVVTLLAISSLLVSLSSVAAEPLDSVASYRGLQPISGRQVSPQSLLPADVLARVKLVQDQVAMIREFTKAKEPVPLALKVTNVQPREVYDQALALHKRSNRLAFEMVGRYTPESQYNTAPRFKVKPYHVWRVIDQVALQLESIAVELGINLAVSEQAQAQDTTPSQVFAALFSVNRELDQMLASPISPNDVYQQLTQAIHFSAKLIAPLSNTTRLAPTPALTQDKIPADVWRLLLHNLALVRQIAIMSGQSILDLEIATTELTKIQPGDVYQLASILVSELKLLHELSSQTELVVPSLAIDDKTPSHVFQRAQLLRSQLQNLLALSHKKQTGLGTK